MPPPRPFSSTFQITSSIEGTPSLSATVSTSLPASDKTVFASTRIELRVRVQFVEATATGLGEGGENKAGKERPQEVSPDLLLNSWVLAEVKEWMDEVSRVCIRSRLGRAR